MAHLNEANTANYTTRWDVTLESAYGLGGPMRTDDLDLPEQSEHPGTRPEGGRTGPGVPRPEEGPREG